MALEVTEAAAQVLRRALELGGVDPQRGGVRLYLARSLGGAPGLQVELAEGPGPQETTVETAGLRLFVHPSLSAALAEPVVDVEEPHERIVLRSKRS